MISQPKRILVVDDDAFVKDMLAAILESSDYSVDIATNGVEAFEKVTALCQTDNRQYDLIISDMNMPEMDGLTLIHSIRKTESDVPIIILTGNNEVSVAINAMKQGANDYLIKDENIEETVIISVQKALEKQQLKTDLAKKNAELEKSNKELIELNQLKNKLLGIAAHDMRTPLYGIKGLIDLLIERGKENFSEDQHHFSHLIRKSADDMLLLLNDILDIAVIESGKLELKRIKLPMRFLLEERMSIQKMIAAKKQININPNFDDCPDILFDPNRIGQVVDNFISNAIKFSPQEKNIYVILSSDSQYVKVTIKDEGPGISEDDQKKLFGEFQRLSAKPTGGEKSTGLGLAIVKKIINSHNGKLEVVSKLGEGTAFSFLLPVSVYT